MVLQFAVVDLGTLGLVNLWQWSRIIRFKIQKGHWPPTTSCFIAGNGAYISATCVYSSDEL